MKVNIYDNLLPWEFNIILKTCVCLIYLQHKYNLWCLKILIWQPIPVIS